MKADIHTLPLTRLTNNTTEDRAPTWSPDSRRIVQQSRVAEQAEIYVVDVASGAATRLTNNSFEDTLPVWRPDTWK